MTPELADHSQRLALALQCQARVLSRPQLAEAATALATELATGLDARAVHIALRDGERSRLIASAHSAPDACFDAADPALDAAVDEAIDQACTVCFPARNPDPIDITRAHAALSQAHRAWVLTVPMADGDALVGALLVERDLDAPLGAEAIALVDHVGALAAPVLTRLAADAAVRTALSGGTPLSTTFRICDRHRVKYIEATSNCAREADGMLIIIGVNRDITATVERNGELERRQVQLERAAANRSRFFATMSHEIRTPLNGVMGVLDLMLHNTLSTAQRERAQLVHSSARQLLNIVNDCLDLSKLHATQLAIHPAETDVRDLAREVVSLMSASIRGGAVTLTASFTPAIPGAVICDPMRLRQVLTNLVGNALKYTDEGSVKLSLDHVPEGGGMLAVEVSDTGIGIPAVALDTLFQRFTQADADEARRRGGTGLGLAICKEIIVAMGGEIGVESREGKGSVFRFRIPAPAAQPQGSQWPDPEPLALCEEDSVAAEPPLPRGAARIILTAQPGDARRILASYLCLGGNEVTFATHGSEVIEGVLGGRLDLVLLDLDMPGLDAASVTRRVRRIAAPMGSVPVLGIADLPFGDKAAACRAADMTAILGKPVTAESLYGAIERALAPPALGPLAAAPLHHDIGRLENSA